MIGKRRNNIMPNNKKTYTTNKILEKIQEIKNEIGTDIKDSIVELAEYLGVSKNTVIAYVYGYNDPMLYKAIQIANYFKCPVEDIFVLKSEHDLEKEM